MTSRIRLREGDLFEFRLPDGRYGYGIVLKRGALKSGGAPYIAIFGSAYHERPSLSELLRADVALAGWTTDALFCHGQWEVFAHSDRLPNAPFPNFKVEMNSSVYVTDADGEPIRLATTAEGAALDFQFSRAPVAFQKAFECLQGFGEWQESYDRLTPAYARARTLRGAG